MQAGTLRAGWSHLPRRKGLVSGIIISGFGFGGAFFSMLFEVLANPDDIEPILDKHDGNLYFPVEIGKRFFSVHLTVVKIYVFIIILGSLLISNYPQNRKTTSSSNITPNSRNNILHSDRSYKSDFESQAENECSIGRICFSNTFITLYTMATC